MSHPPKVLAFAGSTRAGSLNKKLIRIAARAAREAGAEVTLIDLKDFPMPLYDGDLEAREGLPENAKRLKRLMERHDALLLAAPEYNSSITPVLKNTLDWMSRSEPGERPIQTFEGKVAALISASPGTLGGLRGLFHVRAVLNHLTLLVLATQFAVPRATEAFDAEGELIDPNGRQALDDLARELVAVARRLRRD